MTILVDVHVVLTLVFVALTLWANGRYLWSAVKGGTVPHFVTWFAMGAISGMAALLQLQSGARVGAIPLLLAALMNFSNCLAGFAGWHRRLRHDAGTRIVYVAKTDYACGLTALIAIGFWLGVDNAVAAVILLSAASLFAFWPTIRRSWNAPKLELALTYRVGTLRYVIATLAVEHYSFVTVFYPAIWIVVNGTFAWLLAHRAERTTTSPIIPS